VARRLPRRPPKDKLNGKRHHPPCSPMYVDRQVLRSVYIHPPQYNEELLPVCPHCGQRDMRIIYSLPSPDDKRFLGSRCYVCVCLIHGCNTAYKFYDDPSW